MDTSIKWIKQLVPGIANVSDKEYADALTLSGTKVENYRRLDKNLEKIVVGRVVSVEKHPDADKLKVCKLDIGDGEVQIVTGADNILPGTSGQLVPVVLSGGKVAAAHGDESGSEDGLKIKKGKLRGIESDGMMCGIDELGSSREFFPEAPEDGIYIFNCENGPRANVKPGDDAPEALGLRDTIVEYEITNNRVDCYSVIGVAREAAATFKTKFLMPEVKETGTEGDINDMLSVDIADKDLCKRYIARGLKNVKIGPSPLWMQERLIASGIRPISNIVDITNYVMVEMGQPMHAYDFSTIRGGKIVVKRAKNGEKFVTLDEEERNLDDEILLINDNEGAIGIAGIMGGQDSKITDDVETVIFEAATFDGTNIRKAAKRLSLRTDASGKFEKGLDPELALIAINRACQLAEEMGAGKVISGTVDCYADPVKKKEIEFRPDFYNKLLGTNIDSSEMIEYFKRLEVEYDESKNVLIIPTFRQDLNCQADIAEEVARFYGYDKIPVTLPKGSGTGMNIGGISFADRVKEVIMDSLISSGYSQSLTYSFESPKVFDKLKLSEDAKERNTVKILNPLGEDFSIMRTLPVNGMINSLSVNYNRKNEDVGLFELAKVYIPNEDLSGDNEEKELPDEHTMITFSFYGDGDFYSLKGDLENMLDSLGMTERKTYVATDKRPYIHPGRQADVIYKDTEIGYLGQIHPDVADTYGIGTECYICVVDLNLLVNFCSFEKKYTGIANYPAVKRDLSLTVKKDTPVGNIEEVIIKNGGKLLENCTLFDIYEGEQIGDNLKSVAYTVVFRAQDRTLEEAEITTQMDKIIKGLAEIGAELRK